MNVIRTRIPARLNLSPKPCPFCLSSTPPEMCIKATGETVLISISCEICHANGPEFRIDDADISKAVALWNGEIGDGDGRPVPVRLVHEYEFNGQRVRAEDLHRHIVTTKVPAETKP